MSRIGHARVPSAGQDLTLQFDALRAAACARTFEGAASGARAHWLGLDAVQVRCWPDDAPVAWRLDCPDRGTPRLVEDFRGEEAAVVGCKTLIDRIEPITPGGTSVFHPFVILNQFERDSIRAGARAGLAAVAAQGREGGRKPVTNGVRPGEAEALPDQGLSVGEAAARIKFGKTARCDALRVAASTCETADVGYIHGQ